MVFAFACRMETWFYQGWHRWRQNSGVASNSMTWAKAGLIVWIDRSAYRAGRPFWPARIHGVRPNRERLPVQDAGERHVAN